ncbi:MAG TPA: CHASE domain-containing protein [Ignavibacteriaceae bacterium]|nr:CHASE domain-containing protein [Ignavibacteriaceae bacterium]
MAYYIVKNNIKESSKNKFDFLTQETTRSIDKRMKDYEQVLKGGVGLFYASKEVDKDEWEKYVDALNINQNYPGILGIGFSIYIHKNELNAHIQSMRKRGFKNYKVWPEGNREIYTSIIYLEPFSGRNVRAFGYDMYSEPTRHEAMKMAVETGTTAVSKKVILVQETNEDVQPGFLMYLPVFKDTTYNKNSKFKNLLGFVYSPFRMYDLMSGILGKDLQLVNLKIYDGDSLNLENELYNSHDKIETSLSNKKNIYEKIVNISIHNVKWTLKFTTLPAFENTIDKEKPFIILFGGILIGSLIFVISISLANTKLINEKFESILESTGEGIYGMDLDGRCTFINSSASKMLNYESSELIGQFMHDIIHYKHPDGSEYSFKDCPINFALKRLEPMRADNEYFWRKDGTYFPVEFSIYPIIQKNITNGVVITFNDITERKKTLAELEYSLNEKTILLKEVHHRVKNNLQIISSLLSLQSHSIKDDNVKEVFKESQNRISSMALVHEKLYQTSSMSRINFSDYIRELSAFLFRSYRNSPSNIKVILELEDIYLNIDTSITLGLIINELISNSLKHAFPNHHEGQVEIFLKVLNGSAQLTVKDNGIGLPEDFDYTKTNSLGFQLLINLVEQMNGSIDFYNENGTRFDIKFEIEK